MKISYLIAHLFFNKSLSLVVAVNEMSSSNTFFGGSYFFELSEKNENQRNWRRLLSIAKLQL
jgi:hypothetical protein